MFNSKREEENFSEIQKLLAMKRLELPSQTYFDGVLSEFHNRQRASLLQPRYSFVSRLFAGLDSLREVLLPRPALRYAYASLAVVALLSVGLKQSWTAGDTNSTLALQNTPASHDQYAFSQGLEPQRSTVDQQIDAASISPVSLDNKTVMPHYVIAQAPTSYDTSMAF